MPGCADFWPECGMCVPSALNCYHLTSNLYANVPVGTRLDVGGVRQFVHEHIWVQLPNITRTTEMTTEGYLRAVT